MKSQTFIVDNYNSQNVYCWRISPPGRDGLGGGGGVSRHAFPERENTGPGNPAPKTVTREKTRAPTNPTAKDSGLRNKAQLRPKPTAGRAGRTSAAGTPEGRLASYSPAPRAPDSGEHPRFPLQGGGGESVCVGVVRESPAPLGATAGEPGPGAAAQAGVAADRPPCRCRPLDAGPGKSCRVLPAAGRKQGGGKRLCALPGSGWCVGGCVNFLFFYIYFF